MTTQTATLPPFRVDDLPQNRVTRFDLVPDQRRLAEIAADLGLLGLQNCAFRGYCAPPVAPTGG